MNLLCSCALYMHFTWTVDYRTTGILGLLIKFLTVYVCITFHFFALALGGKGVFYSYKKILMLHFCNWKNNALIICSFSVFVENCILLPKGINEFVVFLRIVHVWFWFFFFSPRIFLKSKCLKCLCILHCIRRLA
jgi:hypothetical protein